MKKNRILYIGCGFDGGKSGISVYIRETLPRLALQADVTVLTTAQDAPLLPRHPAIRFRILPRWLNPAVLNMLFVYLLLPFFFRRRNYDILLLPAANRRAPLWRKWFTVAVVHDLSQYHITAKYDPLRMLYIRRLLPPAVRRCDRIVAVSGNTAADLVQYWGIDREKITVNYNGYDHAEFHLQEPTDADRAVRQKYGIDREYLFYVSRIEHPGKNHLRLIQAYEQLPADLRQRYLLVLGGTPWSGSEAVLAYHRNSPCREDIRLIGFVAQADLASLYRGAALYVFPSLYEGFGLSIPEAMACGTPVACSRNSSLGEIAGEAAVRFDPESVPAIAAALGEVLSSAERRRELREHGIRRAADFDWDRHVATLLQLVERRFAPKNTLLGVTYDNISMAGAVQYVDAALAMRQRRKIAFVNADCINQAWVKPEYRQHLAQFNAVFPDGSGLALAGRLLKHPVRDNVNGTDLLPHLVELSQTRGYRLFLFGARPGIAETMRDNLLQRWPNAVICGVRDGFSDTRETLEAINRSRPDILLVALGVPLQEKFIVENFARLNCLLALGVGGLFDFYSGRIPRAPGWLRQLGLEWTFRLAMEPRRMFRRYVLGNPLFIYRVLKYGKRQ